MNHRISPPAGFLTALLLGLGIFGVRPLCARPNLAARPDRPKVYVAAAGVGSAWGRYIEYAHRMADRLQSDCANSSGEVSRSPAADRTAVVGWVSLNRQGEVTQVLALEGPSALADTVRKTLAAAIADRRSFGRWPETMARDLGEETQVAMGFYFQSAENSTAAGSRM